MVRLEGVSLSKAREVLIQDFLQDDVKALVDIALDVFFHDLNGYGRNIVCSVAAHDDEFTNADLSKTLDSAVKYVSTIGGCENLEKYLYIAYGALSML